MFRALQNGKYLGIWHPNQAQDGSIEITLVFRHLDGFSLVSTGDEIKSYCESWGIYLPYAPTGGGGVDRSTYKIRIHPDDYPAFQRMDLEMSRYIRANVSERMAMGLRISS